MTAICSWALAHSTPGDQYRHQYGLEFRRFLKNHRQIFITKEKLAKEHYRCGKVLISLKSFDERSQCNHMKDI